MNSSLYASVCLCLTFALVGCGEGDTSITDTADAAADATSSDADATSGDVGLGTNPVLTELFDPDLFAVSPTTVSCNLDDGSTAQCYRISFANYRESTGPFCPATVDDIGGVGVYDGATNPGFQVLKRTLWEAMEADGFDILDDAGNVRSNLGPGTSSCLEMAVTDLTITFLIPAEPKMLVAPNSIDTVELFGVALYDGMPLTGPPPSVVDGPPMPGATGGGIPSLDPCGGHGDPAGYWHWHLMPDNAQSVLDAFGITDVRCTDIPQATQGLMGFAKDGFPIYAPLEGGSVPADLDACNGKFGVTPDYPEGVYHYYVLNGAAPNLPTCIMGASVRNPMSVQ
jgi:hypothetical protein